MNSTPTENQKSLLAVIPDKYPAVGLVVSTGGALTSVLAFTAHISVLIGFVGAVFGCIAGYYTMRCQMRKWRNMK
jgi:membrane protein DedA with SNARE-associated domain